MFALHLFAGTVLVRSLYLDSRPTDADVRELMTIRSADVAQIVHGTSVVGVIR